MTWHQLFTHFYIKQQQFNRQRDLNNLVIKLFVKMDKEKIVTSIQQTETFEWLNSKIILKNE